MVGQYEESTVSLQKSPRKFPLSLPWQYYTGEALLCKLCISHCLQHLRDKAHTKRDLNRVLIVPTAEDKFIILARKGEKDMIWVYFEVRIDKICCSTDVSCKKLGSQSWWYEYQSEQLYNWTCFLLRWKEEDQRAVLKLAYAFRQCSAKI